MKMPIWAYILYVIVKLLNCMDWVLLALLGKRLQKIDLKSFINSLNVSQQIELEDPDILEPLSLQVKGLHEELFLNAYSRFMFLQQIKQHLEKRVDHKIAIINNPDILKTPVRRPVFLIGLPRSGTTFLHNLLSQDPNFRAPMLWELLDPLPAKGLNVDWQNDSRYQSLCKMADIFGKFIGGWNVDSKHYVRPHLPDECWIPMGRTFNTNIALQAFPAFKEFNDWFFSRGLTYQNELYAFYKQQLQILGYGHGMEKRHFLLKSFTHLVNLEGLLNVFPDACLVFTYRKLRYTMPSAVSLLSTFGSVDAEFKRSSFELMCRSSNRGAENLEKLLKMEKTKKNILFLDYEDLIKDKIGTVMKIYDHFGLQVENGLEENFCDFIKNNQQNKYGKHKYSLADQGITLDDIKSSCKQYISFMEQYTNEVV